MACEAVQRLQADQYAFGILLRLKDGAPFTLYARDDGSTLRFCAGPAESSTIKKNRSSRRRNGPVG